MNKSLAALAIILAVAHQGSAVAASTTELTVTGLITPSACTPALSGGGVVDHGKISAKDLDPNPNSPTDLPIATLQLTVSCGSQILFALNGIDNNPSSYLPTGYGLGLINNTQKIGSYNLEFRNVVADEQTTYPMESSDGGTTWQDIDRAAWSVGTLAGFGIGIGSNRRPDPIKDLRTDMLVYTQIAPSSRLDLSNEVPLAGSATLEVKYL
ncbi:DUF1120 domain-containing protein [Pseudomonas fildesensis]|uniref:Protein GltF n=1 Tax=Pseudomonas fildesensis TaxID=1674920 RepID=A0A0J8G2W8_9PSED|nr:DUF1120 domain-containing protein [Pseudomonas fildesensis]KMT55003.1 hypothetical protein ACR52_10530 [Pseudomonas fildesensis]